MAKVDELVALMTEEIEDFKKSVNKLEQVSTNLNQLKVEPDIKELSIILEKHLKVQNQLQSGFFKNFKTIETRYNKSEKKPLWLIISKLSLILLALLFVFYCFYKVNSIPELERESFEKGEEQVKLHFQAFFNENKDATDIYNGWLQTK